MSKQWKVFISHSFGNKAGFLNVAHPLAAASIPYWNPDTDVRPGSSLREQLRQAIAECCVCVFVATRPALASSWCASELGAFWGAGKPIIVYLADPSLTESDLPEIVQGDVYEEVIYKVVAAAGEVVKSHARPPDHEVDPDLTTLSELTVAEFKRIIEVSVPLAVAVSKTEGMPPSVEEFARVAQGAADRVVGGIMASKQRAGAAESWQNRILWVDDRPRNNQYERQAFERMGLKFTLALSTQEALDILATERFAAVISDMGRPEGPREGYVLLDAMRGRGDQTPFFIYAGSRSAAHRHETEEHGGQGVTNNPEELFDMVLQVLTGPPNPTVYE